MNTTAQFVISPLAKSSTFVGMELRQCCHIVFMTSA